MPLLKSRFQFRRHKRSSNCRFGQPNPIWPHDGKTHVLVHCKLFGKLFQLLAKGRPVEMRTQNPDDLTGWVMNRHRDINKANLIRRAIRVKELRQQYCCMYIPNKHRFNHGALKPGTLAHICPRQHAFIGKFHNPFGVGKAHPGDIVHVGCGRIDPVLFGFRLLFIDLSLGQDLSTRLNPRHFSLQAPIDLVRNRLIHPFECTGLGIFKTLSRLTIDDHKVGQKPHQK